MDAVPPGVSMNLLLTFMGQDQTLHLKASPAEIA